MLLSGSSFPLLNFSDHLSSFSSNIGVHFHQSFLSSNIVVRLHHLFISGIGVSEIRRKSTKADAGEDLDNLANKTPTDSNEMRNGRNEGGKKHISGMMEKENTGMFSLTKRSLQVWQWGSFSMVSI